MTLTDDQQTRTASDSVADLQKVFRSGRTHPVQWRLRQLDGLSQFLRDQEQAIARALAEDLGRPAHEAWLGDIAATAGEIKHARRWLRWWMRPRRRAVPLGQWPATAQVRYEPLGVVLVVGPWNFPVYLTLGPLVAAIAAGNAAIIKPSELAPATSRLLAQELPRYVDPTAIRVLEGDGTLTQELLAEGLDHVLFTGGTEVGKKIMEGASKHLTRVTLELGGKSPAFVLADADLDVAARRIVWGKLLNSGQVCIAPDYVLVDRQVGPAFVEAVRRTVEEFRAKETKNGLRIVNQKQFDRLVGYLETTEGRITVGGGTDTDALEIEPTLIVDPSPDEPLMTEEIFGPILPVVQFDSLDHAIEFVRERPKPLANYVFSKSTSTANSIIRRIPSGGAVVNHVAMHCLVPQLPFGGVGASGLGDYHGRWGFETLSHRKSVLAKPQHPDLKVAYPPYSKLDLAILRRLF